MQSYVAKPSAPVRVQAVQYTAETLAGLVAVDGIEQQDPFDPSKGQDCLIVTEADGTTHVLQVNDYYISGGGVMSAAEFGSAFDADKTAPKD